MSENSSNDVKKNYSYHCTYNLHQCTTDSLFPLFSLYIFRFSSVLACPWFLYSSFISYITHYPLSFSLSSSYSSFSLRLSFPSPLTVFCSLTLSHPHFPAELFPRSLTRSLLTLVSYHSTHSRVTVKPS